MTAVTRSRHSSTGLLAPQYVRSVRCLLGMLGVDVHSKGLRTVSLLLRDHGVEVVYLGEHNSPSALAQAARSEDVDVVGVSFSNSTYVHHTAQLIASMKDAGVDDIPIMIGGLIHRDDHERLHELGVAAIFGPGSTVEEIMAFMDGVAAGDGSAVPPRRVKG
jgi:methylmalonyl-CoA mutase C-terminal domain/subunit